MIMPSTENVRQPFQPWVVLLVGLEASSLEKSVIHAVYAQMEVAGLEAATGRYWPGIDHQVLVPSGEDVMIGFVTLKWAQDRNWPKLLSDVPARFGARCPDEVIWARRDPKTTAEWLTERDMQAKLFAALTAQGIACREVRDTMDGGAEVGRSIVQQRSQAAADDLDRVVHHPGSVTSRPRL